MPPPAAVLFCHRYVSDVPLAVTEKLAVEPAHTLVLAGLAEMAGRELTVKMAEGEFEVQDPADVTTQRIL